MVAPDPVVGELLADRRIGGSTVAASSANSSSEIVLSTVFVNTPAAPLPSPNWAFSRHSRSWGSHPSKAWRRRRFSGTSSEEPSSPGRNAAG
jgi:hypothetical protein